MFTNELAAPSHQLPQEPRLRVGHWPGRLPHRRGEDGDGVGIQGVSLRQPAGRAREVRI